MRWMLLFPVHSQLKGLLRMMFTERERLKNSLERDSGANASQQQTVAVLKQALSDVSCLGVALWRSWEFKNSPERGSGTNTVWVMQVVLVQCCSKLRGWRIEEFYGERQWGQYLTIANCLSDVSCLGSVLYKREVEKFSGERERQYTTIQYSTIQYTTTVLLPCGISFGSSMNTAKQQMMYKYIIYLRLL